ARTQIRHRRCAALGLKACERVAAIGTELKLELLRLSPGRRQRPIGIFPDGVATLPAGTPIDEHEGLGARGRDPDAEALYVVIVNDAIAGLRGAQPLDYLICELHPPVPLFLCPRHVHRTLL